MSYQNVRASLTYLMQMLDCVALSSQGFDNLAGGGNIRLRAFDPNKISAVVNLNQQTPLNMF